MPVNMNPVPGSAISSVIAGSVAGSTTVSTETSLLNTGTSGTIVSLPPGFCIPASSTVAVSAPVQALNSPASGPAAQLSTVSLSPMFRVNPSQLIQPIPLSMAQQQTITVALNQPQQLSTPTSLSVGPQTINVISQPVSQLSNSALPGQGLGFVSPTLLTMPGGPGQRQYLTNPFAHFPIVLGGHQNLITSIDTSQSISSQSVDPASISQAMDVCSGNGTLPKAALPIGQPLPAISISSSSPCKCVPQGNQPVIITKSSVSTSDSTEEPASLSSLPISVFSMPKPAMSVTKAEVKIRQSSPDTTSPSPSNEQESSEDISSSRRIAEQERGFRPISSPSTHLTKLKSEKETSGLRSQTDTALSQVSGVIGGSRMKYTPVDGGVPKSGSAFTIKSKPKDSEFSDNISTTKPDDQDKVQPSLAKEVKSNLSDVKNSERSLIPSSTATNEVTETEQKDPEADRVDKPEDPHGDFADVEDLEESEFVWEDYLKETGATSVPPTAFKHVELSLQSGFSKGMKLEAPNKNSPNTYWVAAIVMTCGPLLRLRYEGYDDNSSADFWSDPMTSDIHPLGWCEEKGKSLQPPEVIEEKYPEWNTFLSRRLETALKAPSYLLDKSTGATPVDQIREGMRVEVQDVLRRNQLWLARIVENVGGRLYLRYEGLDNSAHDFWLFYLHERLHPIGWGEARGYSYHPPQAVRSSSKSSEEELLKSLQDTVKQNQTLSADVFHDQSQVQPHSFQVGLKLEAVDPRDCHSLGPATVVEVTDKFYFIAEMDSMQTPASSSGDSDRSAEEQLRFSCHRNTPTIFPVGWAASKGIKLRPPLGWEKSAFVWSDYLDSCKAVAAPETLFDMEVPDHEFECGMKLEAVNPRQPVQIGAATITQLVDHLVWVHLDGSPHLLDSHVASVLSLDLFPIGWCVSNGYQLQPPVPLRPRPSPCSLTSQTEPKRRAVAIVQPEMADNQKSRSFGQMNSSRDLFGGPQIYINHRCFSGPYLSKGRIAELPRSVGPGPLTLVMKEVLGMLINTAYKSSRVLRELQLEGKPNPDMVQQMLKAKYKGKSYRAVVEICRTPNQLEDFCRQVCLKLQCCPNLIGPHYISGDCPEHCDQLTKTKYTYYYGKRKRKIGRPPGGHSNLEDGQQKPGGKRRKRKRIGMLAKRSSRQTADDQVENADDDKESVCSDTRTVDSTSTTESKDQMERKVSAKPFAEKRGKLARERLALKRRYTHHIPPPSEIRTRGAKLPKYSFEKRTHKKIMIVEGSQQMSKPKKEPIKLMHSLPKNNIEEEQHIRGSSTSSATAALRHTGLQGTGGLNLKSEPPLVLDSNPLEWTVSQVAAFLATSDCGDGDLVSRLKTEEIDGQALLLLTLPNVQEYLGIKLGPAIKLCHLIERVKVAFFQQFAN